MIILAHLVILALVIVWIYYTFIEPAFGVWLINLTGVMIGLMYIIFWSIDAVVGYWM